MGRQPNFPGFLVFVIVGSILAWIIAGYMAFEVKRGRTRRRPMHSPTQRLFDERGRTHGDYATHADCTQKTKDLFRSFPNWTKLNPQEREAMEMMAMKICRVLTGDPHHADHWADIAGYAQLVVNGLPRPGAL